jgi:outer membrane protein
MIAGLLALLAAKPGQAAEGGLALVPGALPNYVGLGVGVANDYVGSDELAPGGLPLARLSWENRYVTLEGNYLAANVINHPVIRVGPAGLYRFGRDHVDDNSVDHLPSIDDTVELGGFAGLEFVAEDDPRKRIYLSIDFLHDVADSHDGYVVSAAARAWYPLARATEFGVSVATSYGSEDYMSTFFSIGSEGAARSGLAAYDASDGLRDARVTVLVIQSLSKNWHVGAGVLYSRLLSEAADSPIVDDRGSANQIVGGIGFVYSW